MEPPDNEAAEAAVAAAVVTESAAAEAAVHAAEAIASDETPLETATEIIAAEAAANVEVIEAQAAAQVAVTEAEGEAAAAVIEAAAPVEGFEQWRTEAENRLTTLEGIILSQGETIGELSAALAQSIPPALPQPIPLAQNEEDLSEAAIEPAEVVVEPIPEPVVPAVRRLKRAWT